MNVLAKFKIPRIIERAPEAPKTLSGEIRCVELRWSEIGSKEKGEWGEHEDFRHEFPRPAS